MKIGGIPIRKKGKFEQSRAPQKPSMAEQQVNKPAKQPKQSGGKKGWIIALALVAIVVLGVCSYGFVLKNQDAIYPNVYVAGVNVGGLKRDAAISAVSEAVQTSYESDTLNVVLPDRTLSLTPEVTQVALNPEQAIDEAMRYGRSGRSHFRRGPLPARRQQRILGRSSIRASISTRRISGPLSTRLRASAHPTRLTPS